MAKIGIVIPTFNGKAMTKKCLTLLREHTEGHCLHVVVVDNASNDGTRKMISKRFPWVTMVRNSKNERFVGAVNKGMSIVRGDYIGTINNDTFVHGEWLTPMVTTLQDDTVGITGPFGGFLSPDFKPIIMLNTLRRDADYIEFSCVLMKRDVWNQSGGLDEYYNPAYYDDTDFSFRIRKLGLRTVITPNLPVEHIGGQTNKTAMENKERALAIEAGRQKFVKRWGCQWETYLKRRPGITLLWSGDNMPSGAWCGIEWSSIRKLGSVRDLSTLESDWMMRINDGEYLPDILASQLWDIVRRTDICGVAFAIGANNSPLKEVRLVRCSSILDWDYQTGMFKKIVGQRIANINNACIMKGEYSPRVPLMKF